MKKRQFLRKYWAFLVYLYSGLLGVCIFTYVRFNFHWFPSLLLIFNLFMLKWSVQERERSKAIIEQKQEKGIII